VAAGWRVAPITPVVVRSRIRLVDFTLRVKMRGKLRWASIWRNYLFRKKRVAVSSLHFAVRRFVASKESIGMKDRLILMAVVLSADT
jgi:hypothetical protein